MCIKAPANSHAQKGFSLIELIIFIVIVSLGLAGILSVINLTSKNSGDPMRRKQALAIAESLLEEISLQPFTYCTPTDPNVLTATKPADCIGPSEDVLPVISTVSNTSVRQAQNVGDYNNFSMNPILDILGSPVAGLGAYTATVDVQQVGDTLSPAMTKNDVLQINVHVTTTNTNISLTGYRFRYAPTAIP